MPGSKPFAVYKKRLHSSDEAIAFKKDLQKVFKQGGFEWFKHYFINVRSTSVEIEIYTKEADGFLRENSVQFLL